MFHYMPGVVELAKKHGLTCSICLDPFIAPVELVPCGHMICSQCFPTPAEEKLTLCPLCKDPFDRVREVCNQLVLGPLNSLLVRCPNQPNCHLERGMARSTLKQHLRECPVPCAAGCGDPIPPSGAAAHADECTHMRVCCGTCHWEGLRKDYVKHALECQLRLIKALQLEIAELRGQSVIH